MDLVTALSPPMNAKKLRFLKVYGTRDSHGLIGAASVMARTPSENERIERVLDAALGAFVEWENDFKGTLIVDRDNGIIY
jgi:hypothetical protein